MIELLFWVGVTVGALVAIVLAATIFACLEDRDE